MENRKADLFQRVEDVDEEPFEGELLVMHVPSGRALALSPSAAVLWEALRWPVHADELAGLLAEANPAVAPAIHRQSVDEILELLLENGLVIACS